jgi:predicted TIM-barrel fold metal-dependent hydrolase
MSGLDGLFGRINDLDSHEMIPIELWGDCFGETGVRFGEMFTANAAISGTGDRNSLMLDSVDDTLELTDDIVWKRAGWGSGVRAPGAIDMDRRIEVLDFMGVRRQLVFFTGLGMALLVHVSTPEFAKALFGIEGDISANDWSIVQDLGYTGIRSWNDWVVEKSKIDPDRLRPVAVLLPEDLPAAVAEAERLIAGGVKALMIPCSVPPGGKSPADVALSPLWSLCEEANVPVLVHILAENILRSTAWNAVPEFAVDSGFSAEFIGDPWSMSTQHIPAQNYLTTMILGGVFERHPRLRFGVIECGAHWVGPVAENLDRWATVFSRRVGRTLSLKPSEYFSRNIRVTGFTFEPIAQYIDRYGLEDVYCYGSDYPHYEGGTDQLRTFAETMAPLGRETMEKFFVTNGDLLMPALAQ